MAVVGIIGGSGLDDPEILQEPHDISIETAYGMPSSPLKYGVIGGIEVRLLARHGREHTIPPSQVNNRANICALADAGCTHILVSTAVGSLREEIDRGDLAILDQFIDFTRARENTFLSEFEANAPVHPSMPNPFDEKLRTLLISACEGHGYRFHKTATVVTIEGPRFSTRAESHMFRSWGADVINMSIAPECALANEVGIPYAAVAMSTDFDSWKEDEEPVTWEAVLQIFSDNAEKVKNLLTTVIPRIGKGDED